MTAGFTEFFQLIATKEHFLVACHIHPDGDGIGCLLAMGTALQGIGKQVSMVCTDGVPNIYAFLHGEPWVHHEMDPDFIPEVLICVDCSEKERVAVPEKVWKIQNLTVVNIDHHITNVGFGEINIIHSDAGATGEICLALLREGRLPIDHRIALALYTALVTDTGFFRYSNTSAVTLESAAYLVKHYRIEPGKVAELVHEQKSYNSVRLLGEVLGTLNIGYGGKVAWLIMDQRLLAKFSVENEETEGFVNYARSIVGVEIALLFKELRPNEVKVSWRSTNDVDVSKLAAYFGGGGHARAAGCSLSGPVEKAVTDVLTFVAEYYGDAACDTV